MGPGVSHGSHGEDRSGIRQIPAPFVPSRMVHVSERPNSRLRVRPRRRQPPGARVGLSSRVQNVRREGPQGRHVPRQMFSETFVELYLGGFLLLFFFFFFTHAQ